MLMDAGFVAVVVVTGLVVVFLGLVLLILFVSLLGLIFKAAQKKKKTDRKADLELTVSSAGAPEPVNHGSSASVPAVHAADDIEDEIVAAITAAVVCMSPEYTVTGIKEMKKQRSSRGRSEWGSAGVREGMSM